MPEVVGIRFKPCGKMYDFEVNDVEVKVGDCVIVESEFGLSSGKVVKGRRPVEQPYRELKKIIRLVTEEDLKTKEENKKLEKEARAFCLERIIARDLPMKLVGAEATLDRKRIVYYFTADGRIDFRNLVKDLAAKFRTRIEMRQIGVRDESKLIGGVGVCGRELCCAAFITSFEPVSIKMAKKQELVLNVGKLSGLCSRLMCCLRYEYDGELDNITSDDEIALLEDAPLEVIEEKLCDKPRVDVPKEKPISHARERDHHRHRPVEHKARTEGVPQNNAADNKAPEAGQPAPAQKTEEAPGTEADNKAGEHRRRRRRHRRR